MLHWDWCSILNQSFQSTYVCACARTSWAKVPCKNQACRTSAKRKNNEHQKLPCLSTVLWVLVLMHRNDIDELQKHTAENLGMRSNTSCHCQIDPGCSPCTVPKSSGCSKMKKPSEPAAHSHASRHFSTKKFASATSSLFAFDSHGKPLGHALVRSGFGPGCKICWNLARENVLQGGETITHHPPSFRVSKISLRNETSVRDHASENVQCQIPSEST